MRFHLIPASGLVFLTLIGATPSFADEPARAIATATATGEFEFDEARLIFSVNNEGQDAADLTGKLAKKANSLIETLKAQGLSDRDLQVTGPTISVRYAIIRNANGLETLDRQKIDGFSGFVSVTARFKDFSKLGKAMSDGVKLGAALSGPNYSLAKSDDKLAGLGVEATKEALANAKAMIEAAGRKAGRVLEIRSEGGIQPMIEPSVRTMAMAAPAPDIQIPVNPGRATLSKTISVSVEILEP